MRFELAPSPAYLGVYGEQFVREFVRAVQGEGTVPASGEDALQVARVVDAAYAASESGRRIENGQLVVQGISDSECGRVSI
jgi:predicted dehydrogenase